MSDLFDERPSIEKVTDALARAGSYLKGDPANGGAMTLCRAHDDSTPSLKVTVKPDGRVLLHCHGGCDHQAVLDAYDLTDADLAPTKQSKRDDSVVSTFVYTDEAGEPLYRVVRRVGKRFHQERWTGSEWLNGQGVMKDVRLVPYRLPDLGRVPRGALVFVLEGEKDADRLVKEGLVATTNVGGAGSFGASLMPFFAGLSVVVLPDNDATGAAHAADVAAKLTGVAADVKVLDLPGLGDKGDVSDWLGDGHLVDELLDLVDATEPWAGSVPVGSHLSIDEDDGELPRPGGLELFHVTEVIARVAARGPRRFLFRGLWSESDHGVIGAEDKAGKSWMGLDAAVSVASGAPFLGFVPTEVTGPVVVFLGEGGEAKTLRRLHAVCAERKVVLEELPLYLCFRVPRLTDELAMAVVEEWVADKRPALTLIDPLYLAARGAKGSDLYAMGEHLEAVQAITQRHLSALMVLTHWNQTGRGTGSERFTGAGPSAWGRVLFSVAVETRSENRRTKKTSVVLSAEVRGDEVADEKLRFKREVWADDPDDLSSPLHYVVTRLDPEPDDPLTQGMTRSARRVFDVLGSGARMTVRNIGDDVAQKFGPLTRQTIQKALDELLKGGLVDSDNPGPGKTARWWVSDDDEGFDPLGDHDEGEDEHEV